MTATLRVPYVTPCCGEALELTAELPHDKLPGGVRHTFAGVRCPSCGATRDVEYCEAPDAARCGRCGTLGFADDMQRCDECKELTCERCMGTATTCESCLDEDAEGLS